MKKYKICDFGNRAYCIISDARYGQYLAEEFIPVKDYPCLEQGLYHFLLLHFAGITDIPSHIFVLYNFTVYFYDRSELLDIIERRFCENQHSL